MGVIGTFGSFTSARMGIYASQAALNVTGNNIANINTKGYTRQSMDLVSLHSGGSDRYANQFSINVGYGVLCQGVSQSRDPYLDIRYRNENSSVGALGSKLTGLSELQNILDEVGKGDDGAGVLEAQFNTIYEQLEILSRNVGSEEYDTILRASSTTLCQLFNTYSKSLETVKENQLSSLKQDINTVNSLLGNIQSLNEQIRTASVHGDQALELRDQRNVYLDELSSYMKIDVTYTEEQIDQYSSVEKLVVSIADSGSPAIELINGIYAAQLEMPETLPRENPNYSQDDKYYYEYVIRDKNNPDKILGYTNTSFDDYTGDNKDNILIDRNNDYDTTGKYTKPYLDENDNPTEDASAAEQISNAVDGERNNPYLFQLTALTDSRGRYMKNSRNEDITIPTQLDDTLLYGALQSTRELLTERGEFTDPDVLTYDPSANVKRGIPYYQDALDALAQKFATMMNEANTLPLETVYRTAEGNASNGETEILFYDKDNNQITGISATKKVVDGNTIYSTLTTEEIQTLREKGALKDEYGFYDGGNLFSTSGDTNDAEGITAANISVSRAWSVGETNVLTTREPDDIVNGTVITNSTRNDNVNHMVTLLTQKNDYVVNGQKYFNGTFQEYFAGMTGNLASDISTSTALYNNYDASALSLDNDRSSVSGVDLNEEATNMMQFQKSYSAACRLLTTIDSMLDQLINGTAL